MYLQYNKCESLNVLFKQHKKTVESQIVYNMKLPIGYNLFLILV